MTAPAITLRIATRASALALEQTGIVAALLRDRHPDLLVELVTVTTAGDADQAAPVAQLGDGAFVRGVEAALLAGRADVAVHSAKDLPTGEMPGLALAAFPERADPRDALVSRDGWRLGELPSGARVATSSPRRAALALAIRPDIAIVPIRGNVDTRLRRLRSGDCDALVLAAAGLARLGRIEEATELFDPRTWPPAAGQGALAVQSRAGDPAGRLLAAIDHVPTRAAILAERAVLRRLGSGCRTPVGAYAEVADRRLTLRGVLLAPDGGRVVGAMQEGDTAKADELGAALAEELIRCGADIYRVEG